MEVDSSALVAETTSLNVEKLACSDDALMDDKTKLAPNLDLVKEGDQVILYAGYNEVYHLPSICSSNILNNRYGNFRHSDIIGRQFGDKVHDRKTGKYLIVLRPSPDLLTQAINHRTQIIYHADINSILMLLDALPGKTILESGTGSGSLTVSLARAVGKSGHIHTFEFHKERYEEAKKDFKNFQIDSHVSVYWRDVYEKGFSLNTNINEEGVNKNLVGGGSSEEKKNDCYADGIFLDLPQPWRALPHADIALKPLGRIVTFSPCVEQVQKTCDWFRKNHYRNIGVFESLTKPWGGTYVQQSLRKDQSRKRGRAENNLLEDKYDFVDFKICHNGHQLPMRGHTSFLVVSTKSINL